MDQLAELMNELENIADGDTLLHWILKNLQVNENVIKHLLVKGARVNAKNNSGKSPLHYALKYLNCDLDLSIVRLLVDRGADVQLGDHRGKYPLFHAVKNKHCPINVIEFLIEKGASVHVLNRQGFSLLHYALFRKHSSCDLIKLLLNKGADMQAVNMFGEAALNVAVRFNRKDIVKVLLENPKVKVNLADKTSYTPLHCAIRSKVTSDTEILKLLLEAGANIEKKTKTGKSSLHLAAFDCNTAIIKLLLDYGARVNVLDKENQTPLDLAIKICPKYNRVAVKFLLDAGALVFSDYPKRNFYPLTSYLWYSYSPFHFTVEQYNKKPSEKNLQRVQLLMKYALLENSSLNFYTRKKTLQLLKEQCLRELHSVCVKPNVTLAQFILQLRLREGDEYKTDEILEILNANVYPLYKEVVSGLLTRKELVNGFEHHMVYTVINGPKQNKKSKCVILNYDSVCKLVKYLSDEAVLNLLLAFFNSNKHNTSSIDFSAPSKTSLDEIEFEYNRFFKRARIN